MREEAKWWIDDAQRSLMKAEKNFELTFYEDCVFQCQQSLEKLFKGLIMHLRRERPEKTHKLTKLYSKLERYVKLDEEQQDFLAQISGYYFIARYPDIAMGMPIEIISKKFASDSLKKTRRIFNAFKKLH